MKASTALGTGNGNGNGETRTRHASQPQRVALLGLLLCAVLFQTVSVSFEKTTIGFYGSNTSILFIGSSSQSHSHNHNHGNAAAESLGADEDLDWKRQLTWIVAAENININTSTVQEQEQRDECQVPRVWFDKDIEALTMYSYNTTTTDLIRGDNHNDIHIPRLIHFRVASRCLQPETVKIIQQLQTKTQHDNSRFVIVLHTPAAVERLILERPRWLPFPHLRQVWRSCLFPGARPALWAALVLYEYGGVVISSDANATASLLPKQQDDNNIGSLFKLHATLRQAMAYARNFRLGEAENDNTKHPSENVAVLYADSATRQLTASPYMAAPRHHPFAYLHVQTILLERGLRNRQVDKYVDSVPDKLDIYERHVPVPLLPHASLQHYLKKARLDNIYDWQLPVNVSDNVNDLLIVHGPGTSSQVAILTTTTRSTSNASPPYPTDLLPPPLAPPPYLANTDSCLGRSYRDSHQHDADTVAAESKA